MFEFSELSWSGKTEAGRMFPSLVVCGKSYFANEQCGT
jgi:hypothetical protein